MELPKEKLEEFRTKLAEHVLYQVFANSFETADRIRQLKAKQAEMAPKIEDINTRLKAATDAKSAALKLQDTAKKYAEKKVAKDALEKSSGEVENIKFEKSRLIQPVNDLYKEISNYAELTREHASSYEFIKTFDGTVGEELPYAEIDGTRYAMKGNILEKNSFGQMVIMLQHNDNESKNSSDKL